MAVIKSGASSDNWTIDPTTKAGKVLQVNAAGTAISTQVMATGDTALDVAAYQEVQVSTLNSSSSTITAGSTWNGTKESTLGVAGIQVNTYMNKKHTVTVYQSMDGNNWDISDSHPVPSGYGVSRTVQATAAYYYVSVHNDTAADATVVRIQTCLCPIVEAMPRSLTTGGNLKVTASAEWQNNRLTTGLYAVHSWRTLGINGAAQSLFSIENPAASTVTIAIRGLNVSSDSTVALATVSPQIKVSRPSGLPTGGTVLTAVKYQSAYVSPQAICRGDTASDGGGETAITATPGSTIWSIFLDRMQTAVGWTTHPVYSLIPDVGADLRQFLLVPGEALYVNCGVAIPTTTHVILNCSWLEFASV